MAGVKGINRERDQNIWKDRCAGMTHPQIAKKYGLSTGRIDQIISRIRGTIPRRTVEDWRQELAEQLNDLRVKAQEIVNADPAPAWKGGVPIFAVDADGNPDYSRPIEDHAGRLAAMRMIVDLQARLTKMLGIDSPEKMQATVDQTVRYEMVGIDPEDLK